MMKGSCLHLDQDPFRTSLHGLWISFGKTDDMEDDYMEIGIAVGIHYKDGQTLETK